MTARLKPIDTLHIPEARFVREDGSVQMVQPALPGEYVRPGRAAYDPDFHRMKLKCPHCDVRVDFNRGSGVESCGANVRGSRPHFKKAPGQAHAENCTLPALSAQESDSIIDDRAGYRIHLNAVFPTTATRHPVYERTGGGKVMAADPRLQPVQKIVGAGTEHERAVKVYREAVAVRDVADIIAVMRRGETERLKNAVVVNGDAVVPWHDFAILGDNRLRRLTARLLNGAAHPVLMKVGFYSGVDGPCGDSRKVFFREAGGKKEFIMPRIYLDGRGTDDAFPVRGLYLVLGVPRLHFNAKSGLHTINMSLRDARFVAPYDEAKIAADAQRRRTPAP